MTATWTAPRTWVTDELVSAALMNEQIRDNLEYLKSPPSSSFLQNGTADYLTSATSFVDVHATDFSLTLNNTTGGPILIGFSGSVTTSNGASVYFTLSIDGTDIVNEDGLAVAKFVTGVTMPVSFVVMKTGLAAGTHTFKLKWKGTGNWCTIYAGGTNNSEVRPNFWVREV